MPVDPLFMDAAVQRRTTGWRGRELFERPTFRHELASAEHAALTEVTTWATGRDVDAVTRADVASPVLEQLGASLSDALEHDAGAVLLPRFAADDVDELAAARAFWALALHLGTPVSQSADGQRLFHVRDAGYAPTDPRFRGPMSSKRLSFHTDRCDVIAFLCLQPALDGGETFVVSSVTLRDELRRRDPRALEILQQPFPFLRHTVDHGNDRPYCELPIFSEHEGHFAAHFLRVLIDRADASDVAPSLTEAQRHALDTLETVAEDPSLHVSFSLEAGDVLLLNNWTTFHRRSAFRDRDASERGRHLLRIWLSMANSRPLSPCFADHFGATAAGALRGGLRPSDERADTGA